MNPVFIFVGQDPKTGKHGVVVTDEGAPLMTAVESGVDAMRAEAREIARCHKMKITLIRFDSGRIVEVIE